MRPRCILAANDIGMRIKPKLSETHFPSIKRPKLDMKSKWRPAVKKTLSHASMLLSLAVHWELIGVATP